ncbi:MAG: hypothetical protein M1826_004385 [Phylliscum demangeonii]|nr:MAG: hypothetical protein M1826_004385 [Phylliscum demangeonii]
MKAWLAPCWSDSRALLVGRVVSGFSRCFTSSASTLSKSPSQRPPQKRRHRNAYEKAQARQRKAANIARQATLRRERVDALGDPVMGKTTPFLESLRSIPTQPGPTVSDLAAPAAESRTDEPSADDAPSRSSSTMRPILNYGVRAAELRDSIQQSHFLTGPLAPRDGGPIDPEAVDMHQYLHENAVAAMARIVSLGNGSSIDRRRLQTHECIEKFGRHRTDHFLAPKPPAALTRNPLSPPAPEKTPRAGRDTGSSEVQISLLTLKIRSLSTHLAGPGKKDMTNKRNLQLLVHRRQKLMKYLRRKERGAERWQHVVEQMGLTDGMWKGEISLR